MTVLDCTGCRDALSCFVLREGGFELKGVIGIRAPSAALPCCTTRFENAHRTVLREALFGIILGLVAEFAFIGPTTRLVMSYFAARWMGRKQIVGLKYQGGCSTGRQTLPATFDSSAVCQHRLQCDNQDGSGLPIQIVARYTAPVRATEQPRLPAFSAALAALLGKDAAGLSASAIGRLKDGWLDEHTAWQRRDLSAKRYVYIRADGIHLQARLEDEKQCILVLIARRRKAARNWSASPS